MVRIFLAIFLMAAGLSSVRAGETLDCSLTSRTLSRALFTNVGVYGTKGAAVFTILDCTHKHSGIYANVFTNAPMREWNTGREVDLRVGWRGKLGIFDNDTSVAVYRFSPGPGKMWLTYNARSQLSYMWKLSEKFSFTPYAGVDLQRIVHPLHKDNVAVFGGTSAEYAFTPKLAASLDVAVWRHLVTPFRPFNRTVLSATTTLTYKVSERVSLGPQYIVTHGGFPTPNRIKHAVGGFIKVSF